MKKGKTIKFDDLSGTEKALIFLAEMLEREDHTAYVIKGKVMDCLGIEQLN